MASNYFWWFGINNIKKRSESAGNHVIYPEIENFLCGYTKSFDWPQNKKNHPHEYQSMRAGDSVLLWLGDGYISDWGIIGYAKIEKIFRKNITNYFKLAPFYLPAKPITPYESHNPTKTRMTDFLFDLFALDFWPLTKYFKHINVYEGLDIPQHRPAVTVTSISKYQFEECLAYSKKFH